MEHFWENPGWEKEDLHLSKVRKMPFQRVFPFIPEKKGFYIIRGPRQIGKSSWLKMMLSHHAKNKECYYLSCENIKDHRELAEILKSLRNRKVVLLDEITFVSDWDRAIKHEVDSGHTHILVITGSHAHDLKRGSDRMPGRFENGGEFYLLPMLFDEFVECRKQAGWAKHDRVKELGFFFRSGGFPIAVAEAGPHGSVPKNAIMTYWRWLSGDIVALGKHEEILQEILIQLFLCMQTPISFQTLAKKTTIGSHNTAKEYISALESCFAVKSLLFINPDTSSFHFKKNRKFYFTDPLLFWMAHGFTGRRERGEFHEKIAELAAHEVLSRKHDRFGYFLGKKGEIDFLLPGEWAVEVKWADVANNLSRSYLELPLLNKKVWLKSNFLE